MSEESRNRRLAEWLLQLGCPVQLTPDDLRKLNTPQWRSIWNHMQKHVMSIHNVRAIKKNLLLSKLKQEGILPGNFGNFRIESIQELTRVQNMSETQGEIKTLKDQIKIVDGTLKSVTTSLTTKVIEKKCMESNIKEVETKTALLKLKLSRMQKDIDKLETEMSTASLLKTRQTPMSHSEENRYKKMIAQYVEQCKFTSLETVDDDYVLDIIQSSIGLPASIVFNGILLASKNTLISLNSCKVNMDSDILRFRENLAARGIFTFSKHLSNLKSLVIQNERNHHKSLQDIRTFTADLEKKELSLATFLEDMCASKNFCLKNDEGDEFSAKEFVHKVSANTAIQVEIKNKKNLSNELDAECSELDHLNWQITSLGEKDIEISKEVDKKVGEINKLISLICNSQINAIKAEELQKCTELATNFFTDINLKHEDSTELNLAAEVMREIEMFNNAKLEAVLGKWRESNDLLSQFYDNNVSKNVTLLSESIELQPKDILKSILEKMCWSQTFER